MNLTPVVVLVVALCVGLAPGRSIAASEIIVAENLNPFLLSAAAGGNAGIGYMSLTNPNGPFFNTAISQRFVPTHGGTLTTLRVLMAPWPFEGDVPLLVSIRSDASGEPGVSLGEASFARSLFPPNPALLDMSSLEIPLLSGQTYHAVFRTETALDESRYYGSRLLDSTTTNLFGLSYLTSADGGSTWRPQPTFPVEIPLAVSVAIPEPGAVLIGLLGSAGGSLFASRRGI